MDINTSFSLSLEKILLSDNCFDDNMANIELISTMEAEKFRGILNKVNPSVLIELRNRLIDLLQIKFDLDTFKIRACNGNLKVLIHDIWYCSNGYVEGKVNSHMDTIFEPAVIPASQFVETEKISNINDPNDINTLLKAYFEMKVDMEKMKKEIMDLKNEKEKMRVEVNSLKLNNDELNKKSWSFQQFHLKHH